MTSNDQNQLHTDSVKKRKEATTKSHLFLHSFEHRGEIVWKDIDSDERYRSVGFDGLTLRDRKTNATPAAFLEAEETMWRKR